MWFSVASTLFSAADSCTARAQTSASHAGSSSTEPRPQRHQEQRAQEDEQLQQAPVNDGKLPLWFSLPETILSSGTSQHRHPGRRSAQHNMCRPIGDVRLIQTLYLQCGTCPCFIRTCNTCNAFNTAVDESKDASEESGSSHLGSGTESEGSNGEENHTEPCQRDTQLYGRANTHSKNGTLPAVRAKEVKECKLHPSFAEWKAEKLSKESLQEAFFGGGHKCKRLYNGKPCHVDLWGDSHTGIEALRHQREWALPSQKGGKKRRELIFNQLVLSNPSAARGQPLNLMVGSRVVCPTVYCDHWCISQAQLDRYVRLVKAGHLELPCTRDDTQIRSRDSRKRDHVITWFLQYAAEVTEKLPDYDRVLLPRMLWCDLYRQFEVDMTSAGYCEADICGPDHFRITFQKAEELSHLAMTTFKRNFTKCKTCVSTTAAVTAALKAHDASAAERAKAERLAHYMLARSDKLHYWQQRWQARSPVAIKLTLIIDKMDSAKNHVPWFSNGRKPKDIDELLKDTLKLHVTGVIIHGKPDARYLFYTLPFMPGNANLNLECICRALVHHLAGLTFRPKLYIQFDNASDNKCYTSLCLCAWLVMKGYTSQVELCMMLPGHTHEDIDAMFRFIADSLRSKGLVRTVEEFVEAAKCAFKNQKVEVQHVAAVHDYKSWLEPNVGRFEQIKTARYFVIACRESDNVPVMWYKPSAAHPHLYPTLKDPQTKMPVHEIVDGEKRYKTDMNGIEIFNELPTNTSPGVQSFEEDRLDIAQTYSVVKKIIDLHPLLFGDAASAWWQSWSETTASNVEDALDQHPLTFDWPTKTGEWKPSTLIGLEREYAETVTYVNTQGQQAFNMRDATQAANEQNDCRPKLAVGDLVVLKPGSDDGMHHLPFWIAEVAEDVSEDTATFRVVWRSAFKGGYAQDDVSGQWLQICVGSVRSRGGCTRYHAYNKKCQRGGQDIRGHGKMTGTVRRNEVVLYFPKLTPKNANISHDTKRELWKLRSHLEDFGGIPKAWGKQNNKRARVDEMDD